MTQPAKHTPGPWKAVPDRSRNLYTWYVEGAKGVVPAIARLSLIDDCEEIEGNAHLIAAAPAMYEAIRKVIEHRAKEYLDNTVEPYCSLVAALAQAEARS